MRALKDIDVVDVPEEKLREVLDRTKAVVSADDYEVLETCVESSKNLYGLMELVKDKEISIKKLLGMLFGAGTEKTERILATLEEEEKKQQMSASGH
jgi:hypothetical protein